MGESIPVLVCLANPGSNAVYAVMILSVTIGEHS
jgi:hypothetical protein